MSLKDIANTDLLVKFTRAGTPSDPPGLVYTGDVGLGTQVVTIESTKCKAASKSICTETISITWPSPAMPCPFTSTTFTFISGAGFVLVSATKTKAEGKLVMRKGDKGSCVGSWQEIASPYRTAVCECDLEISDAGQTKVKAQ